MVGALVSELPCPIILVGYWSALGDEGLAGFLASAASQAVAATLVVGLPFIALQRYSDLSRAHGLETILTISAAMPEEVRRFVYGATTGFIYVIAGDAPTVIARIQAESDLPLVVGKKVSDRDAVAAAGSAGAHAVAVGAALVDRVSRGLPLAEWMRTLRGNR
jgi:tryptophan synthase alpha subunit